MLGVLFFTGGACPSNDTTQSNKVAQTEIYQSYSISQNGQNYDVTAYFRVGGKTGTTLALIAPSKVTFNGQAMQEHLNTSSGTYYTASVPLTIANGVFAFTDRNSKTYTNRIDLPRVALAAANLKTNGAAPVSIPLSAAPSATATFTLDLNGHTVFVESAPGELTEAYYNKPTNSIVVMPVAWKEAASGTIPVGLEVRDGVTTTQGTALGGDISYRYESKPANIALLKGKTKAARPKSKASAKK